MTRTAASIATLVLILIISHQSAFAATGKQTKTTSGSSASHAQSHHARSASDPLAAMQAKYRKAGTVAADFTQLQKNMALGTTKESSGQIFAKRPDKFRWQTVAPDPSLLVSNGHKVWYYTPPFRKGDHGQVIVRRAAGAQSRLAIDLLSGQHDIRKDFKIKALKHGAYRLRPLKPAGDVDHIDLYIEKPTNLVYKLVLFTTTGNQTDLALKHVTLGRNLPDSMFNFSPPEGTEVVH